METKLVFAFEELKVYERALSFCVRVISVVDKIETPRKHFRLIEQLEASSTSIALNISEGKGRFSKKEFKQFLYIARGSLYETVTMLQIFRAKSWLGEGEYVELYAEAEEINRMISGLINSLKV
ncbi:MAG: four helix bundle protein [Deltaproteobacteria bacterium]|nr:MAG: four helix bundle protein [Deltaproteobacteria bacterium]